MEMREDRVAVFIDGANFYATTRALGFETDYKRLLVELQTFDNLANMYRGLDPSTLLRAYYYTAIVEDEYVSIRPLVDWLSYNGFRVRTKTAKEFTDSNGRKKIKGNLDIELAVDALELAPHVGHIVLFSGDGDFVALVEALQRKGVVVSAVSTMKTQPWMMSDELRRQVDFFIDVEDIRSIIERVESDRPERPERPVRRVERMPESNHNRVPA